MLSTEERIRYSRQMILPEYGEAGQMLLKTAKVLVIGAGGLGCPVLTYLAAAGVGKLGVVDHDVVAESNLHRQVLFTAQDVGHLKANVAAQKISEQNPHIQVDAHISRLTSRNAKRMISEYDIVVDGSDNFPTRYLVNDSCVLLNKPMVYGAIHQFEGQVSVFNCVLKDGSRGPNYRDLFPQPPGRHQIPNCAEAGVLGVLPGIIGCMQANEVIKIILNQDGVLSGKLLLFDALSTSSMTVNIMKNKDNPLHQTAFDLIDYDAFCGLSPVPSMSVDELRQLQKSNIPFRLIDVRESAEFKMHPSEGINIPLSELTTKVAEISVDEQVVFLCLSGIRSVEAIRQLNDLNLNGNWYNLEGGLEAMNG